MKEKKEKIHCLYQTVNTHIHINTSLSPVLLIIKVELQSSLPHTEHLINYWTSSPQPLFLEISTSGVYFCMCVHSSYTYGGLSSRGDLQQWVKNLKHRRLLMVRQQKDGKVQLRSGVLTVRH